MNELHNNNNNNMKEQKQKEVKTNNIMFGPHDSS